MAAKTEYKISEPTRLALDAMKAAENMGQAVSDFFASVFKGEEQDAHFNEFVQTFYEPLMEYLEDGFMQSVRDSRALTANKGEVI